MKLSASVKLGLKTLQEELCYEFDRLNVVHFAGLLTRPEIIISTRKSFGGYYQPRLHRIVVSWQGHLDHGLEETLNTFRHELSKVRPPFTKKRR